MPASGRNRHGRSWSAGILWRQMSTCIVTGGAGFLGSHLCDHLLAKGRRVICIDNLDTGSLQNIEHIDSSNFLFVNRDITEPFFLDEDVDFVYHLASPASPIDYARLPLHTLKVGSYGTHHMLGLTKLKRARFLIASTSEVYGDPQVHPQAEDYWGHVNPIGPRGVYDEAKRYAEALTMAYHRQQGVNTCIARIFNTYGPRMRPHDGRAIPTFLRQALQDKPLTVFGDGSQTRSFCFVDDLIRGLVALSESGEHLPVNIGNPNEFTLLELAEAVIAATESRVGDRVRGPSGRRPSDPPARHRQGEGRAGLGARGRTGRRAADDDRARGRRAPGRRRRLAADGAPALLRIAHLTATFPPYRGGAGNTAFRFAREQAERGDHVEVFTAPAEGETPDPGGVEVHRIEPTFAYGNAPLIPALARVEGFDVVHLHYPFIFGSELTLLGRLRRARRAPGAAGPLQEPARRPAGARGAMFEAYEHTVAPALIRAADRVCVLSIDHADSVPYLARTRRRDPAKLIVMPNGVDAEVFSPGRRRAGCGSELGIPADASVAAFVATLDRAHHFKRLDVAIDGARASRLAVCTSWSPAAASCVEEFRGARRDRRRRRARPLPRRGPARRAAPGAARRRPLPAHHRAARVVRHRPDRGDGVRAPGDRERLPGGARGGRRRRDRPAGPAGRPGRGRRRARPAGRRPDERDAAWARRGGRRPRRVGLAAPDSTGWTPPTPRRSRPGGRSGRDERAARILLVSYFYPPCRDTGALRPAAMAKYLRRLGHEVEVLTTSAYGDDGDAAA